MSYNSSFNFLFFKFLIQLIQPQRCDDSAYDTENVDHAGWDGSSKACKRDNHHGSSNDNTDDCMKSNRVMVRKQGVHRFCKQDDCCECSDAGRN